MATVFMLYAYVSPYGSNSERYLSKIIKLLWIPGISSR